MIVLWIAGASGLGAVARWGLDRAVVRGDPKRAPLGTFVVNASGSFVAGALAGLAASGVVPDPVRTVVAVGFLGSFTTFSTWMQQAIAAAQEGRTGTAAWSVLGGTVVGGVAVVAGWATVSVIP